jgi:hypothetical protein
MRRGDGFVVHEEMRRTTRAPNDELGGIYSWGAMGAKRLGWIMEMSRAGDELVAARKSIGEFQWDKANGGNEGLRLRWQADEGRCSPHLRSIQVFDYRERVLTS